MNWQLIKNVNPPKAKVIELYFKEDDSVRFAERSEDGENIDIAETYFEGEILGKGYFMSYEKFKEYYGDKVYWTLFVKP